MKRLGPLPLSRFAWGGAVRSVALVAIAGLATGCGGPARNAQPIDAAGDEVADPFAGVGRPTTQLYAVLTDDAEAMQGEAALAAMWATVGGQGATGSAVRRQVEWVPGDYKLNIDLDFAELPHPRVSAKAFAALAAQLPPAEAAKAKAAKHAIFFGSDAGLLPGDDHIRLAGLAALHAAERHQGVIYDLIARQAWTVADFAAELSGPSLHHERHTRIQGRSDPKGGTWLLTRGEPKWGLPDLQLRGIAKGDEAKAEARLDAARAASQKKGSAAPGDILTVQGEALTLQPCEAPKGLHDAGCVQVPWP